ncbi:MAG: UvrB/UvrC motif-containing protein, partial [Oscillospiraceae bacterium]
KNMGISNFSNMDFGIGNFLGGIFGNQKNSTDLGPEILMGESVCPTCHMRVESFLEKGKLGCSDCYTAFRGRLLTPLRQIHGTCEHVGKVPNRLKGTLKIDKQLANLESDLNSAVMKQDFEKAAVIRDAIKELKSKEA